MAAAPVLLLIDKKRRADAGVTGVMYIETIGITAAEIHIVKKMVKRARPYVNNKEVSDQTKLKRDATCSFFSGDTASTATACFLAAGIYSANYSDGGYWPWLAAAILPLSTGYFRYNVG